MWIFLWKTTFDEELIYISLEKYFLGCGKIFLYYPLIHVIYFYKQVIHK